MRVLTLRKQNEMLVDLVYIMGKEVFLRAYFIRMFILDNEVNVIRDLIATYHEDPSKVDTFRNKFPRQVNASFR